MADSMIDKGLDEYAKAKGIGRRGARGGAAARGRGGLGGRGAASAGARGGRVGNTGGGAGALRRPQTASGAVQKRRSGPLNNSISPSKAAALAVCSHLLLNIILHSTTTHIGS